MPVLNYVGQQIKNLFSKPATVEYPAKPRDFKERYRGHIENDIDVCILCGACMRGCPSGAITVTKPQYTWEIHPFSCVQCNNCVEVCPVHCLKMVNSYTEPGAEKRVITNKYNETRIQAEIEKQKAIAAKVAAAKASASASQKPTVQA